MQLHLPKTTRCPTRKSIDEASQASEYLIVTKDPRHVTVPHGSGVRCIWCYRRAKNSQSLQKVPCATPTGHFVWQCGNLIACRRCGAYSEVLTRGLTNACGQPNQCSLLRLRRMFVHHCHPVTRAPLSGRWHLWVRGPASDSERGGELDIPRGPCRMDWHVAASSCTWRMDRLDEVCKLGLISCDHVKPDLGVPRPDKQ